MISAYHDTVTTTSGVLLMKYSLRKFRKHLSTSMINLSTELNPICKISVSFSSGHNVKHCKHAASLQTHNEYLKHSLDLNITYQE